MITIESSDLLSEKHGLVAAIADQAEGLIRWLHRSRLVPCGRIPSVERRDRR